MASDLAEFQAWLRRVGPHDLWKWICDAYWHDQLEGTELKRAYLLSKKGVDMRTVSIHPHVGMDDVVSRSAEHHIPRDEPPEDVTFAGTIPLIRPKKLPAGKLRPKKLSR
jgi:hypothetical protein